jgi:hypothetical protein
MTGSTRSQKWPFEVHSPNDCFLIREWTLYDTIINGRSWPVPVLGAEWRISTQPGRSSPTPRTSVSGWQSCHSLQEDHCAPQQLARLSAFSYISGRGMGFFN